MICKTKPKRLSLLYKKSGRLSTGKIKFQQTQLEILNKKTDLDLATPTLIFATALQLDDFQSSHSIHHYH